ncbi:MAG: SDR family oxidoreductase [Pseudomonadota bacterium]
MATVVVTGCNRGIGLELAKQLTERGDEVVAVCRTPSDEIKAVAAAVVEGIDVSDGESMAPLKAQLGDRTIDVLVNNAGILRHDTFGEMDYDGMVEHFRVNTLGPLRVTEALADNLISGSKVVIITSRVGSIADNTSGGMYGYRASKTAVNQVGMNLAHELEPRGIAVALLHPGYVMTDMTGGRGNTDVTGSAKGLINRIDALNMSHTGVFWHAEGQQLPW